MEITVIGAGAIGGTVAAYLIRSGHEVLLCDADPEHVAAINSRGLSITGPVEEFTVAAKAVGPEDLPPVISRAVIAVKSHHTPAAAALLRDRLADDGYVLSLQNGLNTDAIAAEVGADRVVAGFVNFGADYLEPGVVLHGNVATFRVGEPSGGMSERVRELADALPWAEATDNITGYLWAKEAYGAMLFATAVSDLSIADALAEPRYRPLMLALAREVLAQAPVPPMPFDGFDPDDLDGSIDRLVTFNRASAKSHSGIYRDLMVRKRKTEVDDLLGDLSGPLTRYVGELITAIERGERTCEVANLELLAAYERLERLGRPLHAVATVVSAPLRAPAGPLHGVPVAVKDNVAVAGVPQGNGNPRSMAGPATSGDAPVVAALRAPAGPLHGVPVAVKDNVAVAGVPQGNGNPRSMAGPATSGDAPVVAALRAAAADVFATASLLEYAAGAPHPDLPEARNPVDPARTAGGSSGGSAALVAAGVCPAAIGTDTGGSIRIPAAYVGIVGLKPTHGLVPAEGVTPLAPTLDTVGVLARDVATTSAVLTAIAGVDPAPEPAGVTVGLLVDQLDDPRLEEGSRAVLRTAVEQLRAAGVQVVERPGAALRALDETFEPIILHEAWEHLGPLADSDPGYFGPDTDRLLRMGAGVDDAAYQRALARRAELLPAAHALLDGVDVLIGPAVPFVAPESTPVLDSPEGELEGLFSAPANSTGSPALSLPAGTDDAGLPVGLQLTGRPHGDAELLAVAAVVERALA
jgi:2-dehydropantoate 2-reductase